MSGMSCTQLSTDQERAKGSAEFSTIPLLVVKSSLESPLKFPQSPATDTKSSRDSEIRKVYDITEQEIIQDTQLLPQVICHIIFTITMTVSDILILITN